MNQTTPPIVIADDSEDDVFFLKSVFTAAGISSPHVVVNNGKEAMDFLSTEAATEVRVLFLDIKMPLVNGFEVLEWARKQPSLTHLKIVMLSGSDDPHDIQRARDLGADRYLVKYPSPAKAAAILNDVLGG